MAIEFDSLKDLESWAKYNAKHQDGKWRLRDVDSAIQNARKEGATIFAKMRQEAKSLGIPDNIINTDLIAFADDFRMTGQGEVRSVDGEHTLRTFLSKEQAGRSHWKETPATDVDRRPTPPDRQQTSTGDGQKTDGYTVAKAVDLMTHETPVTQPGSVAALFET